MRKDWEVRKFEDVFFLKMGKTPSRDNSCYWNGDYKWATISDINDSKYIYNTKEKISSEAISDNNMTLIPKGTVIMSFKLSIGKVAIAGENMCSNEAIMAFIPKFNNVISDYIYYYIKGHQWIGGNKAVMGITLNKKSLSKNIFFIPPLQTQHQIVEELDSLTSIIEKQKKQLEELDNLAQAIFYDMFGDPIENEKGWKMNKVSNLSIKMSTGPFGSMLHKSDYTVNGIPSINPQNINNRKIITNDISKVSYQKAEELSKYIVRANDIIIARRGDLSKCAIVTDKEDGWLCGTGSFMLEIKDILPILFYYQYTSQSIQKYLKDKCIGATMPNLNQKIIGGIKVIVPPFELQQQFASKIEAIEKQKELIKKSIKETEDLFNSRMDYYFN